MKYKIGDVVRLKSAGYLIKFENWYDTVAKECGGKSFKIDDIGKDVYWSGNLAFTDESIDCLVSEADLPSKGDIYTFDELKKRVDDLKNYLKGYVNETQSLIVINIETELNVCPCGGDMANANSLIKIIN